jgi:hypothetical protein
MCVEASFGLLLIGMAQRFSSSTLLQQITQKQTDLFHQTKIAPVQQNRELEPFVVECTAPDTPDIEA